MARKKAGSVSDSSNANKKLQTEEAKIRRINTAVEQDDIDTLRWMAIHNDGGLLNNGLRSKVWPKLLAVERSDVEDDFSKWIVNHPDTDQVARDIDRSMWRFTMGKAYLRKLKREQLSRIINTILSRDPELHYYQGFHDIASVFLLVANETEAYAMMERLSHNHIRYALNTSLDSTTKLLSLLFPLIAQCDQEVYNFLLNSNVEPFFALSWVLTWFSHGFDRLDIISRLFDFFLATHPLMPLYMGAAIILHFRDHLINNVECEYSAVHGFLSNIPQSQPPVYCNPFVLPQ
eukprot:TRINITY_DN7070_c0_g1_i2.p1 TRINITY_DN7070_c0_g1~~TRINITY_DN7070_c0_g1_i2.p1  ORF type:complete len:290 (-),score=45.74 TRINITY_DN7070_c0_g1_i2:105-974(-)